jgi:ketosteroid isomerase-like protein
VSESTSTTPGVREVARTPEQLHDLFLACAAGRDLDGMMALYEAECAGGDLEANILPDKAALEEFISGFLEVVRELTATTRKCLVSGEIALLSSEWHAVVEPEEGKMVEAHGRSAEVARRQPDGTWRFVIDDPIFAT